MPNRCPICEVVQDADISGAITRGENAECPDCGFRWEPDAAGAEIQAPRLDLAPEITPDIASKCVAPTAFETPRQTVHPRASMARKSRSILQLPRGPLAATYGLAICMALVGGRDRVVRAVPASSSIYAAMGMPVNLRGLAFQHVLSRIAEDSGQRVLAIEGEVANLRPTRSKFPDIQVSVRSNDGREIYSWNSPAPKKEIAAGETVYFRARLAAPPSEGADVKIRFASVDASSQSTVKK